MADNSNIQTPRFGEPRFGIADFRAEKGWSLDQLRSAINISSKGRMSEIEAGKVNPTVAQALAIEEISDGRINAADLNSDVAAARAGCDCSVDHDTGNSAAPPPASIGQSGEMSTGMLTETLTGGAA